MKAVHICQEDTVASGGAVRVAFDLVRQQLEKGIDASCFFVNGTRGSFGNHLGTACHYLHADKIKSRPHAILRLRSMLNAHQPDIIHHHDGLVWTHLASKTAGTSASIVGHGHLTAPSSTASWRHRIAGRVHSLTYDHLFCVSPEVANTWLQIGMNSERVSILPNGIDLKQFKPPMKEEKEFLRKGFGIPDKSIVFCFVGRLHDEVKRCFDFIRAVANAPSNVKGLVAGTGIDATAMRNLATELNVSDRIYFTGLLDPATPCYQASDVFLMTSSYEPFGLVVLEAAACGIPIVGFRADGGVNSLMEKLGAVILSSRDPAQMAKEAIKLTRGCSQHHISTQLLATKEFSWSRIADELIEKYHQLSPRI